MTGPSDQPIKVSYAALTAAADNLTNSSGTISGRLDQLESDLRPMSVNWTGQASDTYRVTQQKWDTAAAELAQILRQIGTAVRTAGENYQATDSRIGASWGS